MALVARNTGGGAATVTRCPGCVSVGAPPGRDGKSVWAVEVARRVGPSTTIARLHMDAGSHALAHGRPPTRVKSGPVRHRRSRQRTEARPCDKSRPGTRCEQACRSGGQRGVPARPPPAWKPSRHAKSVHRGRACGGCGGKAAARSTPARPPVASRAAAAASTCGQLEGRTAARLPPLAAPPRLSQPTPRAPHSNRSCVKSRRMNPRCLMRCRWPAPPAPAPAPPRPARPPRRRAPPPPPQRLPRRRRPPPPPRRGPPRRRCWRRRRHRRRRC